MQVYIVSPDKPTPQQLAKIDLGYIKQCAELGTLTDIETRYPELRVFECLDHQMIYVAFEAAVAKRLNTVDQAFNGRPAKLEVLATLCFHKYRTLDGKLWYSLGELFDGRSIYMGANFARLLANPAVDAILGYTPLVLFPSC